MSARSIFRVSRWLAGSVFFLPIANFFLIVFVSGTDIFLGQPLQLMVPLFALIVSSGTAVLAHKWSVPARQIDGDEFETRAKSLRNRRLKSAPPVPPYLSMTVIRRPVVQASSSAQEEWRKTIQ